LTISACRLLSAKAGGPARDAVHAHDFVVAAVGHAVVVVADQENDGQAEGVIAGVVVGELRLGGKIERFQDHSVGISAVAGKTADDVAPLQVAVGQRRAGGDRARRRRRWRWPRDARR
jgi:hypothetical protein